MGVRPLHAFALLLALATARAAPPLPPEVARLEQAAAADNLEAQLTLGMLYEGEADLPADYAMAAH